MTMARQAGQREAQYGIEILTLQFIMVANLYATFISANIKYIYILCRFSTARWHR